MAGAIYPDLRGQSVLVTGGGSGIGACIVEAFARQGSKVGFIDIDAQASASLVARVKAAGGVVHFEQADLRDVAVTQHAVNAIRATHGPITILVNNAAHDDRHAAEDVTPDYFDNCIGVNFKHQFFVSQAVLPDMKAAGGGSIICMGSMSWMAGMGGMALYTAMKSAILGLVRSLARDFGPHNIRVNSIAPGWIMTERQLALWVTPEGDQMRLDRQCLKRPLVPHDIARVVLFMSSEEASACTSQSYVVDGGWV